MHKVLLQLTDGSKPCWLTTPVQLFMVFYQLCTPLVKCKKRLIFPSSCFVHSRYDKKFLIFILTHKVSHFFFPPNFVLPSHEGREVSEFLGRSLSSSQSSCITARNSSETKGIFLSLTPQSRKDTSLERYPSKLHQKRVFWI